MNRTTDKEITALLATLNGMLSRPVSPIADNVWQVGNIHAYNGSLVEVVDTNGAVRDVCPTDSKRDMANRIRSICMGIRLARV